MTTFQENLRRYRERAGINAKDFAAIIGIKYTTYLAYENDGREPKQETLCRIAATLHVSTDELLGYTRPLPSRVKPCRFCGEEYNVYTDGYFCNNAKWWFVQCGECLAQGPVGKTKQMAIDAWNKEGH